MRKQLLQRLQLVIILLLFIAIKYKHLFYPYYWDESWPYATAVADMYKHGVSLLPGAVNPEYSRGHPLFFHAAGAIWGHIFGMSKLSMHSYALTISMLFMTGIYEAGIRLFNIRVAVLALLLISTQVIFIVQSGFLLLEIMVAFLAFMSLYSYIRQHYVQTAIYLTMLFLTKESGLIMGFVLGMHALIQLRTANRDNLRVHPGRLLSIVVPCLAIGSFFILQKKINGWYIFPMYAELVEHKWDKFWGMFSKGASECTFIYGNRGWLYTVLLVTTAATAVKTRKWSLLTMAIPIALVHYMTGGQGPHGYLPSLLHFIALLAGATIATYYLTQAWLFERQEQRLFIRMYVAFIFCFIIFSATNYFTYRYLLATLIPGMFLVAVLLDKMAGLTKKWVLYAAAVVCLAFNVQAYATNDGYGDADLGAFDAMTLQQSTVQRLEQEHLYTAHIASGSFLTRMHLTDPATGFLNGQEVFKHVQFDIDSATEYIAVNNIEPDYRYKEFTTSGKYKNIYRKSTGQLWTEIWQRK